MGVLQKVKNVFSKKVLLILLLIILLIGVSVFAYKKYVLPALNPTFVENREFRKINDGESNEAELMMFGVSWCPHCKKAKPIWDALKQKYHGKQINNTTVYFKYINCEEDEATADKYKIEGYPTIKLVKNNEIIEFDAKPTEETLTQFLHSTL